LGEAPKVAEDMASSFREGHPPRNSIEVLFVLRNGDGGKAGSLRLYEQTYQGGGWYDDAEEVLEVRSGVVQILIAPVQKAID
jgi:hypothetical protein